MSLPYPTVTTCAKDSPSIHTDFSTQPAFVKNDAGLYLTHGPVHPSQIIQAASSILLEELRGKEELSKPADAAEFLRMSLGSEKNEHFAALFLDNRHRLLSFEVLRVVCNNTLAIALKGSSQKQNFSREEAGFLVTTNGLSIMPVFERPNIRSGHLRREECTKHSPFDGGIRPCCREHKEEKEDLVPPSSDLGNPNLPREPNAV